MKPHIGISKEILANIIILLPFFELLTFEELIQTNHAPVLWKIVLIVYSLSRISFSSIALFKGNIDSSLISFWGILTFIVLENIVSLFNDSLYINFFVGSLTMAGLVLICSKMIFKSSRIFICSCYYLFGFMSILGMLSTFIFPNGFFHAPIKAYAIYFLGSKNTAFFYYIVFIYFLLYRDLIYYGHFLFKRVLWIILFIISSLICDAANSFIILLIILIIYTFNCKVNISLRLFKFKILLPIILVLALLILIEPVRNLFSPIFGLLGRDVTFTGRDFLWHQAIQKFLEHPLLGNGIDTTFKLQTGAVASHAHSHYLDILSKYGVITLASLIVTIGMVIRKSKKYNNNRYVIMLNWIIMFALLVHSIIDHLMIYNFLIILVSIELLHVDFNKNLNLDLGEDNVFK